MVVDSSVVLRIVKHVYDQYPGQASGLLVGLEQDQVSDEDNDCQSVHVSNSFPFPVSSTDNELSGIRSKANIKYQNDMLDHFKEVNIDPNPVGWYVSAHMGRFFTSNVIENMYHYQSIKPESVVLVHDISKSLSSGFSLKAYRLSENYLVVRNETSSASSSSQSTITSTTPNPGKFTTEYLVKNDLSYHNLFQELPVKILNSHLITLYLHTINKLTSVNSTFDELNLSVNPYLEKNIEGLFDSIDEFHYDQSNYNYYQRSLNREKVKMQQWQQKRKAENSIREKNGKPLLPTDDWKSLFKLPEEPSRLDNLLISAQIDQYCNQVEQFGSTVGPKLFAVQKSLEF